MLFSSIGVALFGVPKKILTNNGGEFNNELVRDMAEQLNTIITTTAAESPWSNGIVERHNAVRAWPKLREGLNHPQTNFFILF